MEEFGFEMSNLKNAVKKLIPSSIMQWRRRKIVAKGQRKFGSKTVAETFGEIYEKNVWGGTKGEFYSGEGSTEKYSEKYAAAIRKFIAENDVKSVVDLGCGDFRVASKFISDNFHYTGCDVVPSLVDHLNNKFASENIEFRCVNIVEEELPDGDLCLIRQVLQHLSNAEIERILYNARKYKYLIITEHYPHPKVAVVPNLDVPHGPDMRLHFDSAVYLDKPPFNLRNIKLLLDVEAEEGTRIKTFIIYQMMNNK
jgi:SAM-dependent methyltransferase